MCSNNSGFSRGRKEPQTNSRLYSGRRKSPKCFQKKVPIKISGVWSFSKIILSTFEGIFGPQIDSEDQKVWQKNERTTSDTLLHSRIEIENYLSISRDAAQGLERSPKFIRLSEKMNSSTIVTVDFYFRRVGLEKRKKSWIFLGAYFEFPGANSRILPMLKHRSVSTSEVFMRGKHTSNDFSLIFFWSLSSFLNSDLFQSVLEWFWNHFRWF